jgi:glycosyltransferase involved in cell wall biosynthesis
VHNNSPHIGLLYLGSRGGICYYTFELARALAAHAKVTLYVSSSNSLLEQHLTLPTTVRVFKTYTGMASLLMSVVLQHGPRAVARAVDADAPDILLDTGAGPWGEIVKRRMKHRPLLADVVHDVTFHPDRWQWLLQLQHWVYPKRSDVYVALSRHAFAELPLVHPGARYIESLHGIINKPSRSTTPEEVSARCKRLIFFGRIEAYKGLDVLVEAFALAKRRDPELALSVAGQGPISPELRTRIDQIGIRLLNQWLDDTTLDELLMSHGVMVLPYRSATQSGVVATALSYGLPCVGTRVGGLQEQILEGKTGLLVPPNEPQALADALVGIAADSDRARSMSVEAHRCAETTYSWGIIAEKLLADLAAHRR